MKIKPLTALFAFMFITSFSCSSCKAQDPARFQDEIDSLKNLTIPPGSTIFVGSSSIRLWPDLNSWFPKRTMYNLGFGGSETSDLNHYLEVLLLSQRPDTVLIYEGDNDINSGKSINQILEDTRHLVASLKRDLPDVVLYFISPKPSPSRWHLKKEYETYNQQLKLFCKANELGFIDVWDPMLGPNGKPVSKLFQSDSLHMLHAGYQIWTEAVLDKLDD